VKEVSSHLTIVLIISRERMCKVAELLTRCSSALIRGVYHKSVLAQAGLFADVLYEHHSIGMWLFRYVRAMRDNVAGLTSTINLGIAQTTMVRIPVDCPPRMRYNATFEARIGSLRSGFESRLLEETFDRLVNCSHACPLLV
jgi:hypothetical protein